MEHFSHFKNILHRQFYTNDRNPTATLPSCRLCFRHRETVQHFGECGALKPVFSLLRAFDEGIAWNDLRLNLMGITSQGGVVPPGLSMLHFVAWKFIILALTLKGVENRPFDPHTTLESISRPEGPPHSKHRTCHHYSNTPSGGSRYEAELRANGSKESQK